MHKRGRRWPLRTPDKKIIPYKKKLQLEFATNEIIQKLIKANIHQLQPEIARSIKPGKI